MSQPGRPSNLEETLLDVGRARRVPPSGGSSLAETVVDEGRSRLFPPTADAGLADTLLDEGRERPRVQWPEDGLPAPLSERYEWLERLNAGGSQGETHLVRVRATGDRAVIKRRHVPGQPDTGLADYLARPYPRIVRYLEMTAEFEVMEYLPGETLAARRRATPEGFTFDELHAVVEQVAAALTDLHRHKYVHRDVKPANIMLRPGRPISATLVDFGIASPSGGAHWPEQLNPAYQPPEGFLHTVGPATDWWGLGMTVAELAAGEHPLEGLEKKDIHRNFTFGRAVDVSGVPDDRVRRLCQGLLALDPARRWGLEQVGQWLTGGEDPELPDTSADRSGSRPGAAATPYEFLGVPYLFRDDLAQAMTTAWNRAVRVLFEPPGSLEGLRAWLDQFTDDAGVDACRVVGEIGDTAVRRSGHVRLLRLVQALDPTRPPVYRNHVISRRALLSIAINAIKNEGDNGSVLMDLWDHHLLPDLDSAAQADPEIGGEALTELDRRWRATHERWPALVNQVTDAGARGHLSTQVGQPEVLAVCLRAALRRPEDLEATQQLLREARSQMPVPVPWFDGLTERPQMRWVALLLHGYAAAESRTAADREIGRLRGIEELRAGAAFREWSRRQNRPAALGWAVAGICMFAVGWVALIVGSDAAGWVDDDAIGLAWVGAAVSLPVSLVAECLLAAQIGGRFHARYSIPGAAAIALRPVGRWMRRSPGTAALAILAALAMVGLLALALPQVLAAGTTAAHLIWVVHRWSAWQAQVTTEDAQIAEAQRRRDAEQPADAHR
jgi:hypothetical protein